MQFVDFAPVKLVFGPGRLEALRTEPLPGTRALLLTSNGRSMERIGALARVTAILEERGVAVVHMGVVEPNPMVSTVMKVAARMKDERCDFLVALGGGSVMGIYGAYHTSMTSDDGVQTMASRLTEALGDSVIFHDLREE